MSDQEKNKAIMLKKLLVPIILLFVAFQALAQTPFYKHFSIDDGLPSSEVYQVGQDSKGNMWFATDRGLVRYDGYSFRTFSTQDGIEDLSTLGFYIDKKDRVWSYTFTNKIYVVADDKVVPHPFNWESHLVKRSGRNIISLYVDKNDHVWCGYSRAFKHYNKSIYVLEVKPDGEVIDHDLSNPKLNPVIFIKEVDSIGAVYSFYPNIPSSENDTCLIVFENGDTKKTHSFNIDTKSLYELKFKYIWNKRKGEYLYTYGNKVIKCKNGNEPSVVLDDEKIPFIYFSDSKDDGWVSYYNEGGVYYYPKRNTSEFHHIFKDNFINYVYEDSEGGFWFSSLGDGVFYIPSMDVLSLKEYNNKKIYNVTGVGEKAGKLALGTRYGDVLEFNFSQGKLTFDKRYFFREIRKVHYLDDGRLFVSAYAHRSDLINHKIISENYPWQRGIMIGYSDDKIIYSGVNTVYKRNKRLLYNTDSYIEEYNTTNLNCGNVLGVEKKLITAIAKIDKGEHWLGGKNGLFLLKNGKSTYWGDKHPYLKQRIECIERLGKYYVASTIGRGVVVFNKDTVWNISDVNGLASNVCNWLQVDYDESAVWVATNKGISKLELDTHTYRVNKIINIDNHSGLASNEVNHILLSKDTIYAATKKGVSFFNKNINPIFKTPPKISLKEVLVEDFNKLKFKEAQFPFESSVSFSYVGYSYKSLGDIKYRYRLKGVDDMWKYTESTKVDFSALNDGEYKFEVQSIDRFGKLSPKIESYPFVIAKPFFKKWWFYALLIFTGIWILSVGFYLLFKRFKARIDIKERLMEAEQRALRAQVNPHFMFNALNSIQSLISKNNRVEALSNLAKFARLMRKILQHSKYNMIPLQNELDAIKLYLDLESLRFNGKFVYSINVAGSIKTNDLKIPPLLIQPFIENAIWHGILKKENPEGRVDVNLFDKEGLLFCEIIDDGVGRSIASQKADLRPEGGTFSGVSITKERVKNISRRYANKKVKIEIIDLFDKQEKPCGTKVIIVLPLDEN